MTQAADRRSRSPHALFLFPLVYRPEKPSFAPRFEGLSKHYEGSIFALSDSHRRGEPIGRFRFYGSPDSHNPITRFLRRLGLQTLLPLRLFWGRGRVDMVVAYDPYACGLAGVLIKWLLGARLVVEVNGDHHQLKPSPNRLRNAVMAAVRRLSLSQADAIKILNTSQERDLQESFPGKRFFRFMDFVADGYFRSLPTEEGKYFLLVGHPFSLKGVGELIRAFRQVAPSHPHLSLRIMGYCPPEELAQFSELAAGDPRIQFLKPGWIEDVGEQMRCCYALVNASRFEAGGRVLFEAMACRKPVIATKTNGTLDYIQDGKTGLLCEIGDVNDLAAKLDHLAREPELARALGAGGFEWLMRELTEERYLERYVAMLHAVMPGSSDRLVPSSR